MSKSRCRLKDKYFTLAPHRSPDTVCKQHPWFQEIPCMRLVPEQVAQQIFHFLHPAELKDTLSTKIPRGSSTDKYDKHYCYVAANTLRFTKEHFHILPCSVTFQYNTNRVQKLYVKQGLRKDKNDKIEKHKMRPQGICCKGTTAF